MATTPNQIQQVRELIKSGKRSQALTQLARLIERDHNNAELWWLLANATDDIQQARRALEEVLSLEPNNDRARKMLDRLETRQLLKQMGVAKPAQTRRSMWMLPMVLVFIVLSAGLVVLAVTFTRQPEEVAVVPTELILPTETATELPIEAPTETLVPVVAMPETTADVGQEAADVADVTEETVTDEAATQDPFAPTSDVEGITAEPDTSQLESLPEVTDEAGNRIAMIPTLPLEPTIEMPAPTTVDPSIVLPESTQEPVPLDTGITGLETPVSDADVVTDPFVPQTDPAAISSTAATTTRSIAEQEAIERGQVLNGVVRRDLIPPYGVHHWTFSGYRGEAITLELINITGRGNPSLELRSETGEVVASDIDTINTTDPEAVIELALPDDGVYTVIVRMAAVDEQLYSLKLTRQ